MATIEGSGDGAADEHEPVQVRALRSSPSRTVFTEEGNSDGWISTDVTIELQR